MIRETESGSFVYMRISMEIKYHNQLNNIKGSSNIAGLRVKTLSTLVCKHYVNEQIALLMSISYGTIRLDDI